MGRTIFCGAVLCSALLVSCGGPSSKESLSCHFNAPASRWEECLPLGNGRIGATSDGGVFNESIVLNESSMWSGCRDINENTAAVKYLPEIRALLFSGRNAEAQKLMYETFTCAGKGSNQGAGYGATYGSYQLFSNLRIDYDSCGEPEGYRRELDIQRAASTVEYSLDGTDFRREMFASYADDVMALRLTASRKGALGFRITMDRVSNVRTEPRYEPEVRAENGDLLISGRLCSGKEEEGAEELQGVKYEGRVRVVLPRDGEVTEEEGALMVSGATEAIVLIAMDTDYGGGNPRRQALRQVRKASHKSWTRLSRRHERGFRELFDRVDVDFGHLPERESLDIMSRLRLFDCDRNDPSLIELYYQFGRYLLISSTRPGAMPANLQGLWANTIATPWNGDYHLNINLQMNYWPSESGNLAELHVPLIDWTMQQVESGRRTAEVFYGARGWVTHILGNPWQFTYPGEHPAWGATNTSAAWLCQHLFRHYEYTPDEDYLRKVYPVMKEAALFFADMLVEDPESHWLVTAPTTSPENAYRLPDGSVVGVCAGSTMDNQIVRELFGNVIKASGILGEDADFAALLASKADSLMPTTIGPDGRVMEWLKPYEEVDLHHRHVSHMYGLYPGDEITVDGTPELAQAARKTLEVRGDRSTGWSMAWKINLWARLCEGDHAYKLLCDLLHPVSSSGFDYGPGGGTYPNLFCAHPPFQIDGNFGGCAGIAGMLLQSGPDGSIEVLPALPRALYNGSFRGLCARGGAELSAEWKEGRLETVTVRARVGGDFDVKGVTDGPVHLRKGQKLKIKL